MSRSEKIRELLEWVEHVRLLFDVVAAIASGKVVRKVLSYIPQISHDWASIIAWIVAALVLFVLVLWHQRRAPARRANQRQLEQGTNPIPAASTLMPGLPGPNFDAKQFFRTAYFSPLTTEAEKNIQLIAEQNEPSNPASFIRRMVGVGLVSYLHDFTWWTIYKSQLLMLSDMNAKGGWMSLDDARKYYDKAALDFPNVYGRYSFEQWMGYLKSQQLLIQHPSNMLEITVKGKDFLKYLVHWGLYPNMRSA